MTSVTAQSQAWMMVVMVSGSDVFESFLSSQSHKPLESDSSKIFSSRVRIMTWSSRVTRAVESLRIIGLQARVNVKSHEISRFFYNIFLLSNGAR